MNSSRRSAPPLALALTVAAVVCLNITAAYAVVVLLARRPFPLSGALVAALAVVGLLAAIGAIILFYRFYRERRQALRGAPEQR